MNTEPKPNQPQQRSIDLNGDLGEGTSPEEIARDRHLMRCLSSANICCGAHAGDQRSIEQAIGAALASGVAVGAHPGYPDRATSGRGDVQLTLEQIRTSLLQQFRYLDELAERMGAVIRHVKPHGALYNHAARDDRIAETIAQAVREYNPNWLVYGLSNSRMITAARATGLIAIEEVFLDRNYSDEGYLVARSDPRAMISDPGIASHRLQQMILRECVESVGGRSLPVHPQTACIHSDLPNSVKFASAIRKSLHAMGIVVAAPRGLVS